MNKLVHGVLAGSLLAAPAFASDNEWLSLDQEIESLSASLNQSGGGPDFSGWVLTSWRASLDDAVTGPSGTDKLQGFFMDSVRIRVDGQVANYGYRIEYDFARDFQADSTKASTGLAGLLDAYAYVRVGDSVMFTMGNYRVAFVRSGLLDRNRLMFIDRSAIGLIYAVRSQGLMASGNFQTLDWYLSANNGSDGVDKKYLFNGRLEWDAVGGGVGMVEGAWGAPQEFALTVGGALQDDGAVDKGTNWALDAELTVAGFSLQGEIIGFGDDSPGVNPILAPAVGLGAANGVAGTTPFNLSASFLFNEMYEVTGRFQNSDDIDDTRAYTIGVNRYVQGHDIKWLANYDYVDTKNVVDSFSSVSIGLGVSF